MTREHIAFVVDDHTQCKLRKFTSTRFVLPDKHVPCLSLSNIEVNKQNRRQGHARNTLKLLRSAAAQNNHVFVVESTRRAHPLNLCQRPSDWMPSLDASPRARSDVVSTHLHALIAEMNGESLPGYRPGARGCSYWWPDQLAEGSWPQLG